jgi:hypothetical protein
MSNKQSSVDWLISELIDYQMAFYGTTFIPLRLIEQAKAMHKEETCELAFKVGRGQDYDDEQVRELAEIYYNETFEGGNQ